MVLNHYARNFITKLTIAVQTFKSLRSISAQIGNLQLYDIYARATRSLNCVSSAAKILKAQVVNYFNLAVIVEYVNTQ